MIRNFIYSDSDKIRSISSQIFEGVSEHIIKSSETAKGVHEKQKGPLGSGQLLGDIFSRTESSQELRFLEDYAYTILENKLLEDDLMQAYEKTYDGSGLSKSFVKIKARLNINDLAESAKTLVEFNELGEAFWRVSNEPMGWTPNIKILSEGEVKRKAGESGLYLNKRVADSAAHILRFGYGDLIEATMNVGSIVFSAPIKRKFLREDVNMILHKYSRRSQVDFVMLGIVTQRGSHDEDEDIPNVGDAEGLKNAMRTLALHLRTVERMYSAPSTNEIIIDPIAIYSLL
ncbi:MAG: hypothetical protein V4537_06540 [Pseudomonadota bacterium]